MQIYLNKMQSFRYFRRSFEHFFSTHQSISPSTFSDSPSASDLSQLSPHLASTDPVHTCGWATGWNIFGWSADMFWYWIAWNWGMIWVVACISGWSRPKPAPLASLFCAPFRISDDFFWVCTQVCTFCPTKKQTAPKALLFHAFKWWLSYFYCRLGRWMYCNFRIQ